MGFALYVRMVVASHPESSHCAPPLATAADITSHLDANVLGSNLVPAVPSLDIEDTDVSSLHQLKRPMDHILLIELRRVG